MSQKQIHSENFLVQCGNNFIIYNITIITKWIKVTQYRLRPHSRLQAKIQDIYNSDAVEIQKYSYVLII